MTENKRIDESLLMGDGEVGDETATTEENQEEQAAAEVKADESQGKQEDKEEEKHDESKASIPKERFNQVYAEKKALEEENARLRAEFEKRQQETKAEDKSAESSKAVDIKALRREANEALLEGDMDKMEAAQDKIDAELLRQAEANAEYRYQQRENATSLQRMADAMVAKYPILDVDGGNQEAIDMVVELRDAYIAKGMPMAKALEAASNKVAPLFSQAETQVAGEQTTDQRKVVAIKRGAETANKIPPQGGGVGNRAQEMTSAELDISQKNWDKMSREERDAKLAANG